MGKGLSLATLESEDLTVFFNVSLVPWEGHILPGEIAKASNWPKQSAIRLRPERNQERFCHSILDL